MRFRPLSFLLPGLLLGLTLACGGGSSSAAVTQASASGLTYTNPPATGWRFEKDASSTPARSGPNLVRPTGPLTQGLGLNPQASLTSLGPISGYAEWSAIDAEAGNFRC